MAEVHLRVGLIQSDLGTDNEARRSFQQARAIYQALAAARPDDRDARAGLAESLVRLVALPEHVSEAFLFSSLSLR